MSKQTGYRKLVLAYLDLRRYQHKHPDLADFYTRRYGAMSGILRVDLATPPMANEEPHEGTALHHVFDDLTRFHLGITTPFSGYLEAPAHLDRLAAPYEARLESLAAEQQETCLQLLCELADAIYGPCERPLGQDELEHLGVSDSQAPDPDDYL